MVNTATGELTKIHIDRMFTVHQVVWLIESCACVNNERFFLSITTGGGRVFEWRPGFEYALCLASREDADALIDAVRRLIPGMFPDGLPMPQPAAYVYHPNTGVRRSG